MLKLSVAERTDVEERPNEGGAADAVHPWMKRYDDLQQYFEGETGLRTMKQIDSYCRWMTLLKVVEVRAVGRSFDSR